MILLENLQPHHIVLPIIWVLLYVDGTINVVITITEKQKMS